MTNNFILKQKVLDAIYHIFPIVEKFPKHEKFALITQIKNVLFKILRLTIDVQSSKNKSIILRELDIEISFLKELLIYSNEKKGLKYLSIQSRKSCFEKIVEIGKIIGGMIRSYGG